MTKRFIIQIKLFVVLFFSYSYLHSQVFDGYLLVDHTAVQQFDSIPQEWLDEAKKLTVHYGHTSHGSQILSGLVILNKVDSTKYNMSLKDEGNAQAGITESIPPEERIPVGLPPDGENTLQITREGAWHVGYWSTNDGLEGTKNVLSYNNGLFDISGWAWCGEHSSSDDQIIHDYLSAMEDLETSFPTMRFFYMTGHVDPRSNDANRHNNMIREYCRENNKILYDFADIESWDLDGNFYSDAPPDCEWCQTWCDGSAHDDCVECQHNDIIPPNSDECCSGAGCGNIYGCERMCAHSHGINCLIKGKAFWWMMARLAGWEGDTTTNPTGVTAATLNSKQKITLYPNPAKSDITIKLPETIKGNISVEIYDMQGRIVLYECKILNNNKVYLNNLKINEGIYCLIVKSNQSIYHSTVIIK